MLYYFFLGYLFPSSTLLRLLTKWSRSSVRLEGFNVYLVCFKSFHLACWDPCSTNIFSLPFCCFKYGAFISSSMNYHGCSCPSDGNPCEQLLHKFQHQKKKQLCVSFQLCACSETNVSPCRTRWKRTSRYSTGWNWLVKPGRLDGAVAQRTTTTCWED